MNQVDTSYRGFYDMIGRLTQTGLVAVVGDERDGRVRRLVLEPSADSVLQSLSPLAGSRPKGQALPPPMRNNAVQPLS